MKFKRLIITLLTFAGIVMAAKAESFFQYPIVPDSTSTLEGRCNYLARHFWDFCDMKKAFSAKAKMAKEVRIYLSILENATADSAMTGVERFMHQLDKQPVDQVFVAEVAEGALYSDTAEVWIDQLYIPVLRVVTANKKVDKAAKARFAHQLRVLENSLVGSTAPSVEITTREGAKANILDDNAQVKVLFFNDPSCSDCALARARLHADISASQLISDGALKIIAVSMTEPDEAWAKSVADYPQEWTVGANPDIDLTFDLRGEPPYFYILDGNNKVRFKHLTIDQVLDVFRQLKHR